MVIILIGGVVVLWWIGGKVSALDIAVSEDFLTQKIEESILEKK